jgi:hypothetical protein
MTFKRISISPIRTSTPHSNLCHALGSSKCLQIGRSRRRGAQEEKRNLRFNFIEENRAAPRCVTPAKSSDQRRPMRKDFSTTFTKDQNFLIFCIAD